MLIPDKQLVSTGIDILLIFLAPDPNLLRSYLVGPETPLLGLLVKGLMEDFGDKMLDIFRTLLASNALSGGAQVHRASIMDIFCEKHVPELVDFITASCPEKPGDTSENASRRVGNRCGETTEVLLNICELLCFCVQQDPSRTIFLLQNVTEKVLFLTRRKEKPLVAASVRFFRTLLSVQDDYVQSYIVENNLLKPIVDVFVAGANHDDLLISAILELLEHIRKAKTVLLKYVVDTFWDQLAPFEHLSSIQALKGKNEQCLESWTPKSTTDPVDMRENEPVLDKEEEEEEDNYVKGNRDEEKSAFASYTQKEEANSNVEAASSAPSRSGGLVDYEDDEDDEDNNSPPKKQPVKGGRVKNKSRGIVDEQEQQQSNKKPRLCSTIEGGGEEAKEAENTLEEAVTTIATV